MAPALVQKKNFQASAAGTSFSVATTNAVVVGNALIVFVAYGSATSASPVLTDDKSNTYVKLGPSPSQLTTGYLYAYIAVNCAAGITTVSQSYTGSSTIAVEVMEYSGIVTTLANAVDIRQPGGSTSNTSATPSFGPTGTTRVLTQIAIACFSKGNPPVLPTAGTGWTLEDTSPAGSGLRYIAIEDQQLTTLTTVSPTITYSSSTAWEGYVITLLAAGQVLPSDGRRNLLGAGL